jgi:hypothetical protein
MTFERLKVTIEPMDDFTEVSMDKLNDDIVSSHIAPFCLQMLAAVMDLLKIC